MSRKYIGLWLILSISLILVLLFSLSDIEVDTGRGPLKKAPFREHIFAKKSDGERRGKKSRVVDMVDNEGNPVEESSLAEVDSTQHSILLIGDSMTLNIAYAMSRYAKQNGHKFHAVNWDFSNTRIWSASDTLSHFIREFGATYIFISLGSNELYLKNPDSRRPDVRRILDMVGERPYIWIGPPNWKEDFGINDMLAEECRSGSFFRSAGMEFERKKDRVHPTRHASELWVDSIMRWMPKSAHPILANVPSDSLGKVDPHVTFLKALNK